MTAANYYLNQLPTIGLDQLIAELEANSKETYRQGESATYVMSDNSEVHQDSDFNFSTKTP